MTKPDDHHSCLDCAADMARAHNTLIRGLNAILLQAPHVPTASEAKYVEQDVVDLLFYVGAWCKMVHHHHAVEESVMFPGIEALSGRPGLMAGALEQHQVFHAGLERLLAYASATSPKSYAWAGPGGMKEILDGFSGPLTDHLYEEIDLFLSLHFLDSKGLWRVWIEGETKAKASGDIGMLYDVFPCVLGNADKTFSGSFEFPPLPWILPYVIKYWFAARNGAWRFNPCDFWGQPRPLYFTGSRQK